MCTQHAEQHIACPGLADPPSALQHNVLPFCKKESQVLCHKTLTKMVQVLHGSHKSTFKLKLRAQHMHDDEPAGCATHESSALLVSVYSAVRPLVYGAMPPDHDSAQGPDDCLTRNGRLLLDDPRDISSMREQLTALWLLSSVSQPAACVQAHVDGDLQRSVQMSSNAAITPLFYPSLQG